MIDNLNQSINKINISLDEKVNPAQIKVIGVGGAGNNAVNEMINSGLTGVEFIAINTDPQALEKSAAPLKIQIGKNITEGRGAGGDPEKGKQAAIEDKEKIMEILKGADLVFIAAGMGGGTGTGASPIIAEAAKELDILTVAVVTKPFPWEGGKRMRYAEEGMEALKNKVDSYIIIPNEKLLKISEKSTPLKDSFAKANEVLKSAVQGISELILKTGIVNLDFADVKSILQGKGKTLMGTGIAKGENRATQAIEMAISSPLLEDITISGAMSALISICGDENITTYEVNEALSRIIEKFHQDADIKWGAYIDPNMGDSIKFTLIISGLPDTAKGSAMFKKSSPGVMQALKLSKNDTNTYLREGKTPTPTTFEDMMDIAFEEDMLDTPAFQRLKNNK